MKRTKPGGHCGRTISASSYIAERLESRTLLTGAEFLDAAPALFVENRGQWADPATRFALLGSSMTVRFTDQGLDFRLSGQALDPALHPDEPVASTQVISFSMRFNGASLTQPLGHDPAGLVNFMLGEPSTWRSGVPSFTSLIYPELYPGIDLHIRGLKGSLKYEFHVAPGVDYRQIQVRYDGIEGLWIADDGALHVGTAMGSLVDSAPVVYQEDAGGRRELSGSYELLGDALHGFEVGAVDANLPLVIDPEMAWSTYLGGASDDFGRGIAVDTAGDILVTGFTYSTGWVSGGGDASYNGGNDAFVVKLTPQGKHIWSTYLGGTGSDYGFGVAAADAAGNVFVGGTTFSAGWTSGGWNTAYGGSGDAFIVKLDSQGQHLWSSYLGGTSRDSGRGIAVDPSGNVLVAGETESAGWASGGWDSSHNGYADGFVAAFNADGHHLWSTYLGATKWDRAYAVAVDPSGNVLVTGETTSSGWISGGWDATFNGLGDAFVVKLNAQGKHVWSTYLGGSNDEYSHGITADSSGNVLVVGYSYSSGWISRGWDTSYNGGGDAFVVKLNASGQHVWSTYLGGAEFEYAGGIAVDGSDNVLVTGYTNSSGWTVAGWDTSYNGGSDAFVAKFTPQGLHLWSSYLGGTGGDSGYGITADRSGNVLVTGQTTSSGWTAGGHDTSHNGELDAFVAKFSEFGSPLLAGTPSSDAWCLRLDPDDPQRVQVFLGDQPTGTPVSLLDAQSTAPLVLRGIAGHDSLTIDLTHGNPLASIPLSIESGRFALSLIGGSFLDLPGLALASSATLDLAGNGLILRSGEWSALCALLHTGRTGSGGPWTGTGIASSLAAMPENAGRGLAMLRNDAGDGTPIVAAANGIPLPLSAILIRYTWEGDTDLNGIIDGDDYFRLDAGFLAAQTAPTYRSGDLNYDGQIDGHDYHLLDRAFLAQRSDPAGIFSEQLIVAEGAFLDELPSAQAVPLLDTTFASIALEPLPSLFDQSTALLT